MFPDIIREDIFRLETRRLWLRWPILADAPDAAGFLVSDDTRESASGDPFAAAQIAAEVAVAASILADWRAGNAAGSHLSLVLTGRGPDRRSIGGYRLGAAPRQHRPMRSAAAGVARAESRRTGARDGSRAGHGGHRIHADRDPACLGVLARARSRIPPRSREMRLHVLRNGARPRRPMDGVSRRRTGSVSIARPGAA